MRGDFSKINILSVEERYGVVLMQQGRVQLDSDWNERAIAQWMLMEETMRDLIGDYAAVGGAFKVDSETSIDENNGTFDFKINKGAYYIRGSRIRNNDDITYEAYRKQFSNPDDQCLPSLDAPNCYLVMLESKLRHITHLENEHIREVALGGRDTATRIKNTWRLKLDQISEDRKEFVKSGTDVEGQLKDDAHEKFNQRFDIKKLGQLKARVHPQHTAVDDCNVNSASRYRGRENQFYRVEIHSVFADGCGATFKWSRENGSVVFPILSVQNKTVRLSHLGDGCRLSLNVGDWVEIVDDDYEMFDLVEDLLRVESINRETGEVTLSAPPKRGGNSHKHPLLRRWDHIGDTDHGGAVAVDYEEWLALEDGIQIFFGKRDIPEVNDSIQTVAYQTRDWWWIPARTATGDIEWPEEERDGEVGPVALGPLDHSKSYVPLAIIDVTDDNQLKIIDFRKCIEPLGKRCSTE